MKFDHSVPIRYDIQWKMCCFGYTPANRREWQNRILNHDHSRTTKRIRRRHSIKLPPPPTPLHLKQRLAPQLQPPPPIIPSRNPAQLHNFTGPKLVNFALFLAMMWKPHPVVIPKRRHQRHRRAMWLLSVGAAAFAQEQDCGAEEGDGGCDADGDADVGACREVAVGW
jgi:hypothetical protein